MYGLEPTDGVAYNAYMPILQSAFAVSGPSPTTTTTRTSTTTSKATTAPTTTTRATSASSTKTTSSSPAPTGNCAAKYGQCGVSTGVYQIG
jgi:endoglucanase